MLPSHAHLNILLSQLEVVYVICQVLKGNPLKKVDISYRSNYTKPLCGAVAEGKDHRVHKLYIDLLAHLCKIIKLGVRVELHQH